MNGYTQIQSTIIYANVNSTNKNTHYIFSVKVEPSKK